MSSTNYLRTVYLLVLILQEGEKEGKQIGNVPRQVASMITNDGSVVILRKRKKFTTRSKVLDYMYYEDRILVRLSRLGSRNDGNPEILLCLDRPFLSPIHVVLSVSGALVDHPFRADSDRDTEVVPRGAT